MSMNNKSKMELEYRMFQLEAAAASIAQFDGYKALYNGSSALEVAISLSFLLDEDLSAIIHELECFTCFSEISEGEAAARALANMASCITVGDAESIDRFFSMSYLTAEAITRAREAISAEIAAKPA